MSLPPASFPEMYKRCLVGPLFLPWARVLIERAAPARGERILDIACGTGIVARTAKESVGPEGRVVGIDLSRPMLAIARTVAPAIDWRDGNAADLPLGAGEQFDVVFCQQGLQFFPDKPAAARQFRRALAPGGRLTVATWRPDAEIPNIRRAASDCRAPSRPDRGPAPLVRRDRTDRAPAGRVGIR